MYAGAPSLTTSSLRDCMNRRRASFPGGHLGPLILSLGLQELDQLPNLLEQFLQLVVRLRPTSIRTEYAGLVGVLCFMELFHLTAKSEHLNEFLQLTRAQLAALGLRDHPSDRFRTRN